MGIQHKNGYSATVTGYFAVGDERYSLAKTNGKTFVLAESVSFPPGTQGRLVVIVDGDVNSRLVELPDGAAGGMSNVSYTMLAPF
jgi:hypothetical protein